MTFAPESPIIPPSSYSQLIEAGKEVEDIIEKFKESANVSFKVVIEGRAARSHDNPHPNNAQKAYAASLSYNRARNLHLFWKSRGLLRNIERAGFSNYYVIAKDIIELEEHFPKYFDKILLDAPCSGEGMFRKDEALIESWKERDSEYFSPIQKRLIQACINMLKDGGKLVYSTCTFDVREDEEIIQYALDNNSNIKLLPIEKYDECSKLPPITSPGPPILR